MAGRAGVFRIRAGMKCVQYTLRQVPQQVDAELRSVAAARGISLNEAALEALAKGLGVSDNPVIHHDLDEFIGTWREDREFDAAIRAFEAVDEGVWK